MGSPGLNKICLGLDFSQANANQDDSKFEVAPFSNSTLLEWDMSEYHPATPAWKSDPSGPASQVRTKIIFIFRFLHAPQSQLFEMENYILYTLAFSNHCQKKNQASFLMHNYNTKGIIAHLDRIHLLEEPRRHLNLISSTHTTGMACFL